MVLDKYKGIIPAFYACYDESGEISKEGIKELSNHLYAKGVKGVYVGGSSGECIYQNLEERKATLKHVAENLKGKLTLIAHVGAPSTKESIALAKYAEELGYDALSAIPPIYFQLPESAIEKYWSEIMDSTELPFIIYNIPQTTGYNLSTNLLKKLLENDKLIGVKNSSMPVLDIERFKATANKDFIVFNGPDEQYVSGRLIGADSGIGGTYGVMPELFLKAEEFVSSGDFSEARRIQRDINDIIISLCSLNGSMYDVIKEIFKLRGVNIGNVRGPLEPVTGNDLEKVEDIKNVIDETIAKFS
ncbi:dihydrodipicolinate synthase family protein [Sporosarcina sp. E16_3]|uniref:dihydrodipicolinate synthase family protein n=1 Tax=Sporosarcina sp. E16_3 TaxID=2789293 RepID=UPI001A926645|nr:dihydrodipicolinate synthase family protein [Sporosarcina sp. E16_3]MBO0600712.1 dihydrodipicolinate synthase family protein [Sporosarcina sp. E16_3]